MNLKAKRLGGSQNTQLDKAISSETKKALTVWICLDKFSGINIKVHKNIGTTACDVIHQQALLLDYTSRVYYNRRQSRSFSHPGC